MTGKPINIIFDGPPSPESGRFVEVETDDGCSINIGEWSKQSDGFWALRITELPGDTAADAANLNELEAMLDCVQVDGTISGLDEITPQSTLGEVLYGVLVAADVSADLLAACKLADAQISYEKSYLGDWDDVDEGRLQAIRAAITKATT